MENELDLLRATFTRAVLDFKKGDKKDKEEATYWLLDDERHHICSFVTICDILGFDPDRIRTYLGLRGK